MNDKEPCAEFDVGLFNLEVEAAGIEPEADPATKHYNDRTYVKCDACSAALVLHLGVTSCRCMTLDPRLRRVVDAWEKLPEHLRAAVEAICLQPAVNHK